MENCKEIHLVESLTAKDENVLVVAPFAKAKVGNIVLYCGGCLGKVVKTAWIGDDNELLGLLSCAIAIYDVEEVYNSWWKKVDGENEE